MKKKTGRSLDAEVHPIDPMRVRLVPGFGNRYLVHLDDERVGWVLMSPYSAHRWTCHLLGEYVSLTGPTSRKALHRAVCSALHGLQA